MSECTNWTNWTICGHCTLRVPCDERGINAKPHNCEVIYALKEQVNAALSDIQKRFEYKFAELNKQLSSCIDVGLMYSERQSRETWHGGAQVSINDLYGRVTDLEMMVKEHLLCVDNSQADENAKCLGLAPIAQLNTMVKDELKSAMRITTLEHQLGMRNAECQAALNEANKLRERVVELSKENEILRHELTLVQECRKIDNDARNIFNGGCKL